MEWYFLGWFLFALFILFIYALIVIKALTTRVDIDESEEFSGVINVKANNKAQHDRDVANRMRNDFDRESG